jgi:hypothetical protein
MPGIGAVTAITEKRFAPRVTAKIPIVFQHLVRNT